MIEAPSAEDHSCWDDGVQNDIDRARYQMYLEVSRTPTESMLEIYEKVRNKFVSKMDMNRRLQFLQDFPSYRSIQSGLYKKKQEKIPSEPKTMRDLRVDSEWFKFNKSEMVVKGDLLLEDGRRIVLFSTNEHLVFQLCWLRKMTVM